MAKSFYGITNKENKWMFYPDGRLMVFDDARIAYANLPRLTGELPGAPFLVREIGEMGEPVEPAKEEHQPKIVEVAGRKK